MKENFVSFFKPRWWTVLFTIILVCWQYVYAFRGVDFSYLSSVQKYFGFGISSINWNNFIIRSISLTAMWLIVALVIFIFLWVVEEITVRNHNRKISKNYTGQPATEYESLLKSHNLSFKKHFASKLWLSGFFILILFGLFFLSGLVENIRTSLVLSFITTAQDSGTEIDYYSISVLVTSFLVTLPFWYLYACLDEWCLVKSRKENDSAKIEDDHFSVELKAPTEIPEAEGLEDQNTPASPVI